jgi:hypothetical protein
MPSVQLLVDPKHADEPAPRIVLGNPNASVIAKQAG